MTDRELMQQALDVMEAAIKAGDWKVDGACDPDLVLTVLRARLTEPEPEPWGYISHKSWKMPVFVEADNLEVSGLPFNNPNYTPVYKTPPQREWQGLTDEERTQLWDGVIKYIAGEIRINDFARAIEAKLKEKNT